MNPVDTWAGQAQIERYETEQREREHDLDAQQAVQDRYERTALGWGCD